LDCTTRQARRLPHRADHLTARVARHRVQLHLCGQVLLPLALAMLGIVGVGLERGELAFVVGAAVIVKLMVERGGFDVTIAHG
jgi:hypothetical protein